MIIFDRNSKNLDIPVGLGNLEINIVTPVSPGSIIESAVTEAKGYTDEQVESALTEANQYTDEQVESALTEAKNYTDEQVESALTEAKGYTDEQVESALTEAKGYTDEQVESALTEAKNYTDGQIEGLDIPKTYVLNLMTNEERAALYEELVQYEQVGTHAPSDDFPAEKYNFYIYRKNGYDGGAGFVPMNFIGIRTGSSAKFVGIVTGYVGRTFKHLTYEYDSTGQGSIRENWCSVFSLNGQKGELNLKTINNESILGEGNIDITGGTGSSVSYEQTLTGGTEIGQITIDGSATTIYAPEGGGGGATKGEVQTMIDTAIGAETARTENTYLKQGELNGYATKNWVEGKGYVTSADTADFVTSAQTKTQIEGYHYTTSADTAQAISSSLTEYYTSEQTDQAIQTAISGIDLSNYYNRQQTDSAISTAVQNKVSSTAVATIWKGTQAQYDAIASKDPNTLYIIVG